MDVWTILHLEWDYVEPHKLLSEWRKKLSSQRRKIIIFEAKFLLNCCPSIFLPRSLYVVISVFIKQRILLHILSQALIIPYITLIFFPIYFRFNKCFNNFHLSLRPATLLKKRLWYRCFPVNFVKFPRTSFLQNTSGQLLLQCNTIVPKFQNDTIFIF